MPDPVPAQRSGPFRIVTLAPRRLQSIQLQRAEAVTNPSPKITELRWGSIDTEAGNFRDAKLWPGGGRGWDWKETGTDHSPGIQPSDVEELLANGAEIVVLGRGQSGRLNVMEETLAIIRDRGATPVVIESREAVATYNTLVEEGRAVGALIHSTC